ncbi:hypothetical protein PAXRUDRAFT_681446 [Paxillus rubicundulus Ve08.2h10]|uniref:Uncharacterized protein n=1 Tax=Paxillus rubicundulus Ve08.2h10 TaxID=930991 RepID=A0A0D0D1Q8_9AGAM|nr:hypothetical protein PAXRUDRAFT_681446 [Paxillus rubicundulus Ve08.2h10]
MGISRRPDFLLGSFQCDYVLLTVSTSAVEHHGQPRLTSCSTGPLSTSTISIHVLPLSLLTPSSFGYNISLSRLLTVPPYACASEWRIELIITSRKSNVLMSRHRSGVRTLLRQGQAPLAVHICCPVDRFAGIYHQYHRRPTWR